MTFVEMLNQVLHHVWILVIPTVFIALCMLVRSHSTHILQMHRLISSLLILMKLISMMMASLVYRVRAPGLSNLVKSKSIELKSNSNQQRKVTSKSNQQQKTSSKIPFPLYANKPSKLKRCVIRVNFLGFF